VQCSLLSARLRLDNSSWLIKVSDRGGLISRRSGESVLLKARSSSAEKLVECHSFDECNRTTIPCTIKRKRGKRVRIDVDRSNQVGIQVFLYMISGVSLVLFLASLSRFRESEI